RLPPDVQRGIPHPPAGLPGNPAQQRGGLGAVGEVVADGGPGRAAVPLPVRIPAPVRGPGLPGPGAAAPGRGPALVPAFVLVPALVPVPVAGPAAVTGGASRRGPVSAGSRARARRLERHGDQRFSTSSRVLAAAASAAAMSSSHTPYSR